MLYRRTPRNPPTLLLRIVATAGAGTLIGMASCGGETSTANGSMALVPATQNPEPQGAATPTPDDSGPPSPCATGCGAVSFPCGGGPCGSVGQVEDAEAPFDGGVAIRDASVADVEVHGVVPLPEDAGSDAHRVGIIGVVPDHDGSTITCPPLCGIVIGVVPNPGH